ncbi:MAG: hypothetical protein WC058_01335 [Phycisphaeraceae bacterium]
MDDPRTTQALRELAEMYLSPTPGSYPESCPGSYPESCQAGAERSAAPGSLRLTPDDSPESSSSFAPPELLLTGHLPGPATLWFNQYAQQLVQKCPVVAALHLTDDDITLDLFGESDPRRGPFIPPADVPSLPEAINTLAPHAPHWLLHITHLDDPLARAAAHQTRRWTLLTGCDEAAVVAAYRLLKQLLEGRPDDSPRPTVALVFLGCDEADAQQAAQRLARTAREHLNLAATFAGCRQHMLPVRRRRLGHYPLDTDLPQLLATLTDLPTGVPASTGMESPSATPGSGGSETSGGGGTKPRPVVAVPPSTPHPSSVPALVSFLPALHPLQARPPRHPQIELALDDTGRLHLLAPDNPAADDAWTRLFAARAWAVEHLPLLALTAPDRKCDTAADPVLHLFTERAKHFGPLAHTGRPDSPPFQLHLLLPVTVGDHTTYTCVELN